MPNKLNNNHKKSLQDIRTSLERVFIGLGIVDNQNYQSNELRATIDRLDHLIAETEISNKFHAAEDRFSKALLQANPDVVFRLNKEGDIIDYQGNLGVLVLPKEKFINANIKDLLTPLQGDECLDAIKRAIVQDELQVFYHDLEYLGEHYYFEGRIVSNNEDEVVMIVRDITSFRDSESRIQENRDRLRRMNQELKLVDNIYQALVQKRPLDDLIDKTMEAVPELIDVHSGRFYLYNESSNSLELKNDLVKHGLVNLIEEKIGRKMNTVVPKLTEGSSFSKSISEQKVIVFRTPEEVKSIIEEHTDNKILKTFSSWAQKLLSIKSFAILPLVTDSRLFGIMTVASSSVLNDHSVEKLNRFAKGVTAVLSKSLAEQEILTQKSFFDELLNHMPTDIVVFDSKHRYTFINETAVKDQATREWLIGKTDLEYCSHAGLDESYAIDRENRFNEAISSRSEVSWIDSYNTDEGEQHILKKYHPIFDGNEFKLMIGYGIDITERIKAEELTKRFAKELETKVSERTHELEHVKVKLEESLLLEKELSKLKSRFVSTASHQFRTPLTVIQSSAALLEMQKDKFSEEGNRILEKALNRINTEVARMTKLMNDVLILERITNSGLKPEFKKCDLIEIAKTVIAKFNHIQKDGRSVDLNIQGNSKVVFLDGGLFEHAFSNIISNAFKYSAGKPSPEVHIEFAQNEVSLQIVDFGIGIPEDDLKNLFTPFYRAANVLDLPGTGLGTSIMKEYIELNKGTIEIISELNKGTTVLVKFRTSDH